MEKNYENLVIDFPDDGIARITMNRPERLNALTYGLVEDLHAALDFVDSQHEIRALIITGAGRGFCAGLDIFRVWNCITVGPARVIKIITRI